MEPNTPIVSAPVEPAPAAPVAPVPPAAPKKSSNVVLIIILAVLALAGIGFGVYEFLQNQNQNQSQTPTPEPEVSKFEITTEEAEKVVVKYLSIYSGAPAHYVDVNYDKTPFGEGGYNDKNFHAQVAFENTLLGSVSQTACPKQETYGCESVPYNIINAKYKELFGSDKELAKKDYQFACSALTYDATKNIFVHEEFGCGGALLPFGYYQVKDTEALTDGFNINVYFTKAKYNTKDTDGPVIEFTLNDGTTKTVASDGYGFDDVKFIESYAEQLPVYQFQFKYDAGNFVLTDVVKL